MDEKWKCGSCSLYRFFFLSKNSTTTKTRQWRYLSRSIELSVYIAFELTAACHYIKTFDMRRQQTFIDKYKYIKERQKKSKNAKNKLKKINSSRKDAKNALLKKFHIRLK